MASEKLYRNTLNEINSVFREKLLDESRSPPDNSEISLIARAEN